MDAARTSPCGSPCNGLRSRVLQSTCKFRSGKGSNPGAGTPAVAPIPLDQSNLDLKMPAEANNLPDSEAVPSSLPEVSPILRVAHKIHPTHPRIAYLCEFCNKYHNHDNFLIFIKSRDNRLLLLSGVLAALEESLINDETHGDGKVRPSDARDMQNFYLEYYEKNIQALFKFLEDNRYFEGYGPGPMPLWPTPTDGLQPSRTFSVLGEASPGGTNSHCAFRTMKLVVFLTPVIIVIGITAVHLATFGDLFLSTGWGLLLISQACKPLTQRLGLWPLVMKLAWGYDFMMGFILFAVISMMSMFFGPEIQTRLLFNQAFSRGLMVSHILTGRSSANNQD
ncbi:hypothetical protein Bca4012_029966 [Brassica carinata]